MGRRRTKDLDLPPRLYRRGSSYYYVSAAGKWYPLGKDKARALRLWAELECAPVRTTTVTDVVQQWLDYLDGEGCPDAVAASSRTQYGRYARAIAAKFGTTDADALTVPMLARWRDREVKPIWFNGCLAVLRGSYRKGNEWGTVTTNAPKDVTPNHTTARSRYLTDEEFRAIRENAPTWLQVAMDLAYLTGMRESDVAALRWNAVGDTIRVEQIKTGNRQAFEITPALRAVLEGAKRRRVLGLFVVATDKGRPITTRRIQKAFAKAREAAQVVDARFHDIRGKAATDAADEGMDYQAMLGHSSKKMSDRYIKSRRTVKAPALKRRV